MQFAEPQSKGAKCIHRFYRNKVKCKIHQQCHLEGHKIIIKKKNNNNNQGTLQHYDHNHDV